MKESCFTNNSKVLSVVPVFIHVGSRPLTLLPVVSKIFEKLVKESHVDNNEKFLTSNFLVILVERVFRAFNMFDSSYVVAPD